MGAETAMTVLDQLVKQKIIAREFVDFYYCRLYHKPYPAILPSATELCQMTTDQIEHNLAEYCGIPQTNLDEYFSVSSIDGAKLQLIRYAVYYKEQIRSYLKQNTPSIYSLLKKVKQVFCGK